MKTWLMDAVIQVQAETAEEALALFDALDEGGPVLISQEHVDIPRRVAGRRLVALYLNLPESAEELA